MISPEELARLACDFEEREPEFVLAWAAERFRSRLVLSCSFGGAGGMALLDMLMRIDRAVPVSYLNTGLLFDETLASAEAVRKRYGIAPIAVIPRQSVEQQEAEYGADLWTLDPRRCCTLRKIEPQQTFLRSYDAWITGIRRGQTSARGKTPVIQWDERFGLVKINPLATWDEDAVRRYIAKHDVPYNPLLARGYASIGCTPCTRPVQAGEDARAGRWSGSPKTECGLHLPRNEKEERTA